MRSTFLSTAAVLAVALAATPAAAKGTFSGFYAGVHAGYGWNDVDYAGPVTTLSFEPDGFVGGVHGGYAWQWDGWVAGLEGNFDFVDGDESDTFGVPDTFDANWEAAIRARVGAVWQEYLIYGAAGISWLDYDWTVGTAEQSQTQTGWTWAVGIERALGGMGATLRLEYRQSLYDDETLNFPGPDRIVEPETQAVTLGVSFAL